MKEVEIVTGTLTVGGVVSPQPAPSLAFGGQEKREYLRIPLQYEIRYRKYLKPNQDFKNAYIKNISMSGAMLEVYESFENTTLLEMKLAIQDDIVYRNISILCKVVWQKEMKKGWLYQLGVVFCEVDKKTKAEISSLIEKACHGKINVRGS